MRNWHADALTSSPVSSPGPPAGRQAACCCGTLGGLPSPLRPALPAIAAVSKRPSDCGGTSGLRAGIGAPSAAACCSDSADPFMDKRSATLRRRRRAFADVPSLPPLVSACASSPAGWCSTSSWKLFGRGSGAMAALLRASLRLRARHQALQAVLPRCAMPELAKLSDYDGRARCEHPGSRTKQIVLPTASCTSRSGIVARHMMNTSQINAIRHCDSDAQYKLLRLTSIVGFRLPSCSEAPAGTLVHGIWVWRASRAKALPMTQMTGLRSIRIWQNPAAAKLQMDF